MVKTMLTIKQAVILAGGRGIRLAPITDNLPKPMVDINGKPFIQRIIEKLKDQGVSEVVILTGYMGDLIEEYFVKNTISELSIVCVRGPNNWDTGQRIIEAKGFLDETFLLLYGDNYIDLRVDALLDSHYKSSKLFTMSVVKKSPGNLVVDENGQVTRYLITRGEEKADLVEVGFNIINREELCNNILKNELSLPKAYESIVRSNMVNTFNIPTFYLSISDLDRLAITREELKAKKIIFLDRDGVINVKAQKGHYVSKASDFNCIEVNLLALEKLSKQGFEFIIITNQAGIARGMLKQNDLDKIHNNMICEFKSRGINLLSIYVCPHHWDENCECRKPKAGMFFEAARDFKLQLSEILYIGDDERDEEAAILAGCRFILISQSGETKTPQGNMQFHNLDLALPCILELYDFPSK
jgi:D-glycero-D-manno-heptose 1,7-bisphosphate phosphatase